MNKQDKGGGRRGIEWTDYTWNPVGGCRHACRWTMPDGSVAICYAELQAERGRSATFYPEGFQHHYWRPQILEEPLKLKTPAKIFLDSMSDLMGHWVPDEEVRQVLDVCARAPQHTFQLLTKNAPRLLQYEFPDNVWVGVSSPPSSFMGGAMKPEQQRAMLFRSLDVLQDARAAVTWLSIEPLSGDIAADLEHWMTFHRDVPVKLPIRWAVIGAASNGPALYQPRPEWVRGLLRLLDLQHAAVFFKGNLDWPAEAWREEFPLPAAPKQAELL